MPPRVLPRLLILLSSAVTGSVTFGADPAPAPDPVWMATARLDVVEAWHELRTEPAGARSPRERLFVEAVLLLNRQPRTERNLDLAAEAMAGVLKERVDDELALAARYYRARIKQLHRRSPDPAGAIQEFWKLQQAAPESFFGQLALLKYAAAALRVDQSEAEQRGVIRDVEARVAGVTEPALRRNLHFVLGDFANRVLADDAMAYHHYAEALKIGFDRRDMARVLPLRCATLALRLGRTEDAIAHYRHFLERFPHEQRSHEVRLRLAALEKAKEGGR